MINGIGILPYCPRCGSRDLINDNWRWNGDAWEHRCADLNPQVGYEVPDLVAEFEQMRAQLAALEAQHKVAVDALRHIGEQHDGAMYARPDLRFDMRDWARIAIVKIEGMASDAKTDPAG